MFYKPCPDCGKYYRGLLATTSLYGCRCETKGQETMTKDIIEDRNYLRTLSAEDLIARVRSIGNPTDLEVVLADELEAAVDGIDTDKED